MRRVWGFCLRALEVLFDAIGFLIVGIYTVVCKVLSWAWLAIKAVSAFIAKAVSLVIHVIIILADRAMELLVDKLLWPVFSKIVPDKYKFKVLTLGFLGFLTAFALTVDYMASEAKANDLIKADTTSDGGDK